MTYPRIIIRNFSKGWNATDFPSTLTDDEFYSSQTPNGPNPTRIIERPDVVDAQFRKMLNLFVTYIGRLKVRGGQKSIVQTIDTPMGFTRYFNQTVARLVYAVAGGVYAYDETANSRAALGVVQTGAKIDFETMYDVLYWCDGVVTRKWNGLTATDQAMGVAAPTIAPGATAGGAGFLNSTVTGASPYIYYVTYVEADGTESNPSPGSPYINVTNQQVVLTVPVSPDPAVTGRNIYRIGGTLTTYRLVGSMLNNTTTTYTDNVADTFVGPNLLSFTHDMPPSGISFLSVHKNRMVAAGNKAFPYRLYLSSYGQPNYWPVVIYDPVNDGGFLDVPDPEFDNPIVGLVGTGSLLLIATSKSFYALYGDTMTDFAFRKVCDTGCIARRSLVQCKNNVLFLAPDGMVYSLEDTDPKPIALPLETLLKTVAPSDLVNASAVYQDQRYTLFIPQVGKAPVNISFDFRVGCWTDVSDPLLSAGDCYGYPNSSLLGETLISTAPGYTDSSGAPFNGILSVFLGTLSSSSLLVDFQTPYFELGRPSFTKRAKKLRIEGGYMPGTGTPLAVTITASTPGRTDVTKTYPITASAADGKMLDVEISPKVIGRRLSFEIVGSVTQLEINSMELSFQYVREAA